MGRLFKAQALHFCIKQERNMATEKKTLVLGASDNPTRYSFLAMRKLAAHGHPVVAIGKKAGKVGAVSIETERLQIDNVDTVTLYLNPTNQNPT